MLPSIEASHRFAPLPVKPIERRRSLDEREWQMPARAPAWHVKDADLGVHGLSMITIVG